MQKLFIILASFCCFELNAQQIVNPFPKTITVNGKAEMEIIPDEIYVQVDLREYEKKGEKITIDQIKSDFLKNVRNLGIVDSAITIASYEGFSGYPWWRQRRKAKPADLLATISYQVKLNSSYKVDELVNVLDDDATTNFRVTGTSHTRIKEWTKQLKMQAVQDAREKARYLSEAVNEKLGQAVTITEPNDVSIYYFQRADINKVDKYAADEIRVSGASREQPIDFRKIKLKFEVNVVYALQ
jgi:uncharacterized protein YggE